MADQQLTPEMLASDIRQLALEVNNLALTTSALVEILSIDKAKLKDAAQKIYEAAVQQAQEDQEQTEEQDDDPLSASNIETGGQSEHPENAVIFGG